MEYYNIQNKTMTSVNISDITDLSDTYYGLKDSLNSIIEELTERVSNESNLPEYVYHIVFDNFDYENDSLKVIEIIKKMMYLEEFKELPQLSIMTNNVNVLIEMYVKAMMPILFGFYRVSERCLYLKKINQKQICLQMLI